MSSPRLPAVLRIFSIRRRNFLWGCRGCDFRPRRTTAAGGRCSCSRRGKQAAKQTPSLCCPLLQVSTLHATCTPIFFPFKNLQVLRLSEIAWPMQDQTSWNDQWQWPSVHELEIRDTTMLMVNLVRAFRNETLLWPSLDSVIIRNGCAEPWKIDCLMQ
ncbi:hypothetical protein BKA93DRAFT_759614 [Sparassis latifolia]